MAEDLNRMHLPTGSAVEREIFEPENAWPDASGRVMVGTLKMQGGVLQIGYDPETDQHWMRAGNAGAWSEWITMPDIPPPPELDESGEYETRVMTARRGPGRPRKEPAAE